MPDNEEKSRIRKLLGWTRERVGHRNSMPFVTGNVPIGAPLKSNRRQAIEAQKARGRKVART